MFQYPNENYINSVIKLSHLKYIQYLVIETMVGHGAAIPPEAGYRYDTVDTKTYFDIHFEALQSWK